MDEEPSSETTATESTVADAVSADTCAASENTVDLGSPSTTQETKDDEEGIINLEGRSEEFKTETTVFDDESEPASEEPATEVTEKPKVEHKLSYDTTNQIQEVVATEEVNLDIVRQTIVGIIEEVAIENIFGQFRQPLGPAVTISSESSVVEEEEPDLDITYSAFGIQTSKEQIYRPKYEEEYLILKSNSINLRRKHGVLKKKMCEYYRKRKMTEVFEETATTKDMYETLLDKYEEKVNDYSALQIKSRREKEAVDNEITDMTNLCTEQSAELVKSFAAMQSREKEIGYALIDCKTGKPMSNKVVDRLVFRQKAKSDEIASIRLAYIKRRDKVKEIENKIKALETIGGTLHLMDFEQLRMENQNFSDKIEERDAELMRLRDRYSHAVQAVAHIREKINTIEVQIENHFGDKQIEEEKVSTCREHLNKLKIQRDINRTKTDELKEDSGLLTSTKLLLDMENGIYEIVQLREKLNNLKADNEEYRTKLINIRSIIKNTKRAEKQKSKLTKIDERHKHQRPTMAYRFISKTDIIKSLKVKLGDN